MCRNIRTLHNFDPPATEEEIRAASLQFIRKISGYTQVPKMNEQAFNQAVDDVSEIVRTLLDSLVSNAPAKNREVEAMRAKERSLKRFGTSS